MKRRAESGDVRCVRDTGQATGETAVHIGLDGVGDDQIRLNLPQQPAVLTKQLPIRQRIDAAAVNGRVNNRTA